MFLSQLDKEMGCGFDVVVRVGDGYEVYAYMGIIHWHKILE